MFRVATDPTGLFNLFIMTPVRAVKESDEEVLARLGYKQEFKRDFKPLDVSRMRIYILTHHSTEVLPGFWNCIQYHWAVTIDNVRLGICVLHLTFPQLLRYFAVPSFRVRHPMGGLCQWYGAYVGYFSLPIFVL